MNEHPGQSLNVYEEEPVVTENGISILDLILVLAKHKWLIIGLTILAGIAAVSISLLMTNIYRSEAVIVATSTSSQRGGALSALQGLSGLAGGALGLGSLGGENPINMLEMVLKSQELAYRIVEKHDLLPILFSDRWDQEKKGWMTDAIPPTLQDAFFKKLKRQCTIVRDDKNGNISIQFNHVDRQFAKEMVEYYLTELSETLRESKLSDATENLNFLQEELAKTSDSLLREKIYAMQANEIEKKTFARGQKYYSFDLIEPPVVSDTDKKVAPKRALICILSVIFAFFMAIFIAFFLEYLGNIREQGEPEQLEKLRRYLPLVSRILKI